MLLLVVKRPGGVAKAWLAVARQMIVPAGPVQGRERIHGLPTLFAAAELGSAVWRGYGVACQAAWTEKTALASARLAAWVQLGWYSMPPSFLESRELYWAVAVDSAAAAAAAAAVVAVAGASAPSGWA